MNFRFLFLAAFFFGNFVSSSFSFNSIFQLPVIFWMKLQPVLESSYFKNWACRKMFSSDAEEIQTQKIIAGSIVFSSENLFPLSSCLRTRMISIFWMDVPSERRSEKSPTGYNGKWGRPIEFRTKTLNRQLYTFKEIFNTSAREDVYHWAFISCRQIFALTGFSLLYGHLFFSG